MAGDQEISLNNSQGVSIVVRKAYLGLQHWKFGLRSCTWVIWETMEPNFCFDNYMYTYTAQTV